VSVGVGDEVSVGVGELLVESDGLADGEAEGDFVGLGVFVGFGLLWAGEGVADGVSRTRVGLWAGVADVLPADGVGETGPELMCCAVLLRTFPVFAADVWLVR
jgi:hypothetical protein